MVRHNLSTRPFYNTRAVHVALALVSLAALGATAFNLWQLSALSGRNSRLQSEQQTIERKTADLRSRAAALRASIDLKDLDSTIAAADEANLLIGRRVFSWTELFNQFETTLPASVRIASVRPRVERGAGMTLSVVVIARNAEGIEEFIGRLEKTGSFTALLSREEFVREDGTLQATLEGQYSPGQSRGARSRGGVLR
jgi:Tfp pilus assembly protein PilN